MFMFMYKETKKCVTFGLVSERTGVKLFQRTALTNVLMMFQPRTDLKFVHIEYGVKVMPS